jgi:hypothetical protein
MDYRKAYLSLINTARQTYFTEETERHHIIPRSLGGLDNEDNIIYLPIRQHYIAHLLLYKLYKNQYEDQIFAVEAFYNINRHQHLDIHKMPRWIRRAIHLRKQMLWRAKK